MDAATRARLAEQNLAQIEAWKPSSDFDRRMRLVNLHQCGTYLDDLRSHPSHPAR